MCKHFHAFTLYSAHDVYLPPKTIKQVKTDLQINLPPGAFAFIGPRIDLAMHCVSTVSTVIHHKFKKNVAVTLINGSNSSFDIKPGDCIANLFVFASCSVNPSTSTP